MGCCVSTGQYSVAGDPPITHCHDGSKSPPTAEEEAEAVKQVLSETPTKPISSNPFFYTPLPKPNLTTSDNGFPKLPHSPRTQTAGFHHCPDDIFDDLHQRLPRSPSPGRIQRVGSGSFSADPGLKRERLTGKSPVKRSHSSPRRSSSPQTLVRDRLGGGSNEQRRRDPGENSGRRSRSPATRNEAGGSRSNMGRSPSGRQTGISPGKTRKVQHGSGPGGGLEVEGCGRDNWETNPTVPSESLENPLAFFRMLHLPLKKKMDKN